MKSLAQLMKPSSATSRQRLHRKSRSEGLLATPKQLPDVFRFLPNRLATKKKHTRRELPPVLLQTPIKHHFGFKRRKRLISHMPQVDRPVRALPLPPHKALKYYETEMTLYERSEVLQYQTVYFVGTRSQKLEASIIEDSNFGYDDNQRYYQAIIGDHISYRYEILKILGRGSFGQVLKVFDHKEQCELALKVIRNTQKFHAQAQNEVKILKIVGQQAHAVRFVDFFVFREHSCMTFELLGNNLYEFSRINQFQGFSEKVVRKIAVQLLKCLSFLQSKSILHCDLKPENVLLSKPNSLYVKLIDFGSSCFFEQRTHTYIQSRYYRAPEIILGNPYSFPIDMWSLGCVLGELFISRPLFPGPTKDEQLNSIADVIGNPPQDVLNRSSKKHVFPKRKDKKDGLRLLMKGASQEFLDFLNKCFQWAPERRMTPNEALSHEWIL